MKTTQWQRAGYAVLASLALAGCSGEDGANGTSTTVTEPGNPAPGNPGPTGSGPTISGTSLGGLVAGAPYSFTPSATDAEGDMLSFSISGKPEWAIFTPSTGNLAGTPTAAQIGSYDNIVISVSDGSRSQSLAAFSVNVTSPGSGGGTATMSWTAPLANVDGSTLTNLAGYRIYQGASASTMNLVATISNPGITTHVFVSLGSGTHHFAVAALNTMGFESNMSAVGSKTVL